MCKQDEYTAQETDRQDRVDNAIAELIKEFTPIGYFDWDMEIIGEVRDVIMEYVVNQKKWMTEHQFYPYRELDNDGSEPAEMIVTDEQIVTAMKQVIEYFDADELGVLAGDWLGGLCWYLNDGTYSFIPDERYADAFGEALDKE